MRLIILGPPGSGKGTQAKLLCQHFQMAHISTGDIFRQAVNEGTPAGLQAKPYMEAGEYVPDEIVNAIVSERFRSDRPVRFLLDGYPRTLTQAQVLDEVLRELQLPLDAAIALCVPNEVVIERIRGRQQQENRPDDSDVTVRQRLQVYQQTMPEVIDYYRQMGLLKEVDGNQTPDEVFSCIMDQLNTRIE